MSQSITASVINAPFNGLLDSDINFQVSSAYQTNGVTPSVNFLVTQPWPVTSNGIVYVYSNALTGTNSSSSYLTLQDSPDNSTWTAVANLANPILTATSSSAVSGNISLQYGGQQYLRLSSSNQAGGLPSGSFGFNVYFRT